MTGEKIKQCFDLDLLENEKEETYNDCVRINNCDECFHRNNNVCDLDLIIRQIDFASKL